MTNCLSISHLLITLIITVRQSTRELAAMLKAFAMLAALLANTVFASSLAEPSAGCEVIEVALLSNQDSILRIAVPLSVFQDDQLQCNNGLCISLEKRWKFFKHITESI